MDVLERACQAAKAITETQTGRRIVGDGQTALATMIGKTQGHVAMWFRRGKVPPEVCKSIESATDGAVTAEQLRPDVFGPPPAPKRKRAA